MTTPRARELRHNQTDVERVVWNLLRSRRLEGFKFRRQQPIGRYIVDFICFSHRLIIELDGGQHDAADPGEAQRTAFLRRQGFTVLRFWNSEVIESREGVCLRILEALKDPSP